MGLLLFEFLGSGELRVVTNLITTIPQGRALDLAQAQESVRRSFADCRATKARTGDLRVFFAGLKISFPGGNAGVAMPRGPKAHRDLCPKVCPRPTRLCLTPATSSYARKKIPPVSSELTEGSLRAVKLMRPLLCHLSYAAAPVDRAGKLPG